MKHLLIETLTHFPGCFLACVFSHWLFHLVGERKKRKKADLTKAQPTATTNTTAPQKSIAAKIDENIETAVAWGWHFNNATGRWTKEYHKPMTTVQMCTYVADRI